MAAGRSCLLGVELGAEASDKALENGGWGWLPSWEPGPAGGRGPLRAQREDRGPMGGESYFLFPPSLGEENWQGRPRSGWDGRITAARQQPPGQTLAARRGTLGGQLQHSREHLVGAASQASCALDPGSVGAPRWGLKAPTWPRSAAALSPLLPLWGSDLPCWGSRRWTLGSEAGKLQGEVPWAGPPGAAPLSAGNLFSSWGWLP